MAVLITINVSDKLAQQWVDENQGFKDMDDDPENLKGVFEKLIHDELNGGDARATERVRVQVYKPATITDEGAGIDR